jgi:type III secretion protein C
MKTLRHGTLGWVAAAALATSFWGPVAFAAVPDGWKDRSFTLDTTGMQLHQVLERFAREHDVEVVFDVPDRAVKKETLRSSGGGDLLDRLAQAYRFRWFVYGGTLHIVPREDNVSMRLELGADGVRDARGVLAGVGLFDSRFGWMELPKEGAVVVSGPREYVRLARELLVPVRPREAANDMEPMVFRLKYAGATDRVITARGKSETIPGMKTLLSNLLIGQAAGDAGRPRIDADPSLNAVIIRDSAGKRAMYQALIDQLDILPRQVEIEALIVDVDRNKLAGLVGGAAPAAPGATLLVNDAAGLVARLKALEASGDARILATPGALTLNNVAAVLDLRQSRYIPLVGERVADVAEVSAGTLLRVVPRLVEDGGTRVRLDVDVEDGNLGSGADARVTRSTISALAIVGLQQMLMIGGYESEAVSSERDQASASGGVPLLGNLFGHKDAPAAHRERLYLITPHLVGDGVPAQARQQPPVPPSPPAPVPALPPAPASATVATAAAAAAAPAPAVPVSAPVAAAVVPVRTAPVAPVAAPEPTWTVLPGDKTLNGTLQRWAASAGWQLMWELPVDYAVAVRTELHGSFADAVGMVAKSMDGAEIPMKAIFYDGNKVLRIVAKGTEP